VDEDRPFSWGTGEGVGVGVGGDRWGWVGGGCRVKRIFRQLSKALMKSLR
jgi:hypothetical protein